MSVVSTNWFFPPLAPFLFWEPKGCTNSQELGSYGWMWKERKARNPSLKSILLSRKAFQAVPPNSCWLCIFNTCHRGLFLNIFLLFNVHSEFCPLSHWTDCSWFLILFVCSVGYFILWCRINLLCCVLGLLIVLSFLLYSAQMQQYKSVKNKLNKIWLFLFLLFLSICSFLSRLVWILLSLLFQERNSLRLRHETGWKQYIHLLFGPCKEICEWICPKWRVLGSLVAQQRPSWETLIHPQVQSSNPEDSCSHPLLEAHLSVHIRSVPLENSHLPS